MDTGGKSPEISAHQVFISYADDQEESPKNDRKVADRICSELESRGVRCWIAHRDILAGEDWLNAIFDAVETAKVMVVVFSANTEDSDWVYDEVKMALENRIKIIPFRIEKVTPKASLRVLKVRSQWLDAFTLPLEDHLEQLVTVVARHLGQEPGKTVTRGKKPPLIQVETPMTGSKASRQRVNDPTEVPEPVKAASLKADRVEKNEQGYWEAYYQDEIVMVHIPAGEFMMGQTNEERERLIHWLGEKRISLYANETPLHKVYLDGYWIGKYEVTFAQYDRFCEETHKEKPGDRGWGRGKRPVINVSWGDAVAYSQWLSTATGLEFQLPSEAQWEKAARGPDLRIYPWGNREPDKTLANVNNLFGQTTPVGSCLAGASPYGLLDMAGNVWEWCSDWYDSDYYQHSPPNNPQGPNNGSSRVLRGGCWILGASGCRSAYRNRNRPGGRVDGVGFRLLRSF